MSRDELPGDAIAIVGLACRFPGARDAPEFWRNLEQGVESVTFHGRDELVAAGAMPGFVDADRFVPASSGIGSLEAFDAALFGYGPRDAELVDPQLRLFLELGWEALEDAGHAAAGPENSIGVWAGAGTPSRYFLSHLLPSLGRRLTNPFHALLANSPDFLTTQLSFRMDLRGPSLSVNTACSTSLVAVCEACTNLVDHRCDIALAGGVNVLLPQKRGYVWQEGDIYSRDGHTRPFDAAASGTIVGDGGGLVVLRRLADARRDGDDIRAVIRGWATTNDGAARMFYTAPGVEGQTEAIAAAQAQAGVEPRSIGYVEAHGSASELGDSIELAALHAAFEDGSGERGWCALGSVKSNFGHLVQAAGVAGLIKTVLSLQHRMLPPTLNFTAPNPDLGLDEGPFVVNDRLRPWEAGPGPRRAGVTSSAMGGTNAHVVLEEAPAPDRSSRRSGRSRRSRDWQLLPLSARTPSALEAGTDRLVAHLEEHPDVDFADVCHTLRVGRRALGERRVLVCRDAADAARALAARDPERVLESRADARDRPVAFLFPGVGDHYPGMGRELYEREPAFRDEIDRGCELLAPRLGCDLREVLFPRRDGGGLEPPGAPGPRGIDLRAMRAAERAREDGDADPLDRTRLVQPAVFLVELALARLWMAWGVRPDAMLGHSIGEYVAACLAGVFSTEDALWLVAERARLVDELPTGAMLAVMLDEAALLERLPEGVVVAAVNGPSVCVAAGGVEAVGALESELRAARIFCRRVPVTHAFHSPLLEPIAGRFRECVDAVERRPPRIPFVSNLTGTWIRAEEATAPGYWVRHACETVRFADGVATLWDDPRRALLEVGPGASLCGFAAQQPHRGPPGERVLLTSLRTAYERDSDVRFLLGTLGKLWLAGVAPDWEALVAGEGRRRVPLPTYAFDRERYWVDAPTPAQAGAPPAPAPALDRRLAFEDWFSVPVWRRSSEAAHRAAPDGAPWLLFAADDGGLGERVAERARGDGVDVTRVRPGSGFAVRGDRELVVDPTSEADYESLLDHLEERGRLPGTIVHLWSAAGGGAPRDPGAGLSEGFFALLHLAQAWTDRGLDPPARLFAVSRGAHAVLGDDADVADAPWGAPLFGPCAVLPLEHPGFRTRCVDVEPGADPDAQVDRLMEELARESDADLVAHRGRHRWVRDLGRSAVASPGAGPASPVRRRGVYLITGGLGAVGLSLAEQAARELRARLVLMGRHGLPEPDARDAWLGAHPPDDPTSVRIRRVRELEALGAEVQVLEADVCDDAAVGAALEKVRERFGGIDGVFHAAGVPGDGLIGLKTREAALAVLDPKVRGTLVLERHLAGFEPDFLVLFSSLASLVPALGQVDYCAANAFLDAFAAARDSSRCRVVAVNWGLWRSLHWGLWEPGSAAGTPAADGELGDRLDALRGEVGITPEEGWRAVLAALAAGPPQVVVSPQDVDAFRQALAGLHAGAVPGVARADGDGALYARPALRNALVEPRDDLERAIAGIWRRALHLDAVGVHDDFVALGGHSLLAMQVISELRDELGAELSLRGFFERPTVAALAESLRGTGASAGEAEAPRAGLAS